MEWNRGQVQDSMGWARGGYSGGVDAELWGGRSWLGGLQLKGLSHVGECAYVEWWWSEEAPSSISLQEWGSASKRVMGLLCRKLSRRATANAALAHV